MNIIHTIKKYIREIRVIVYMCVCVCVLLSFSSSNKQHDWKSHDLATFQVFFRDLQVCNSDVFLSSSSVAIFLNKIHTIATRLYISPIRKDCFVSFSFLNFFYTLHNVWKLRVVMKLVLRMMITYFSLTVPFDLSSDG